MSTGTLPYFSPGSALISAATSFLIRSISVLLVGPRLDAPELMASYPVPAAEGRGQKYLVCVNCWPMRLDPTTDPLTVTMLPLALCGKMTCATPVMNSG